MLTRLPLFPLPPGSEVAKLEGDIAAAMDALKQLETDAMEVGGGQRGARHVVGARGARGEGRGAWTC